MSGSENLARAVDWAVADDEGRRPRERAHRARDGAALGARHGKRRRSSIRRGTPSPILGLGGTAPTPPGGIEAEVLVVTSFDDLRVKGAEAKGRIVLFNVPYNDYSETVTYRTGGARTAAQYGAVAVLVRSVGPLGLRTHAHRQRDLSRRDSRRFRRPRSRPRTPTASRG